MCNIIRFLVLPPILGNQLFRDFLSWMFNVDSHVLLTGLSGVNLSCVSLNLFEYHSLHCPMAISSAKLLYNAQQNIKLLPTPPPQPTNVIFCALSLVL